ncbi:MAG: metallophosphoesterase family protein [Bacteroidota bacterium]
MKNLLYILLPSLFFAHSLFAQIIIVQPYLQNASPHSIYILWETDSGSESIVEWGLTDALGNIAIGTAQNSFGDSIIHEVKLEGLERFTKYYYRVKTGAAISDIYHFKTAPFASDHESFRIIAMSDMQKHNSIPNKFEEIVHDGIIEYLEQEFGGDIADNLAFVIAPGDLVRSGTNYSLWENHFFDPSHGLFNHVPVYPALGNHDKNSPYYFQYFKLPDNGTPGYEEHWWYKDYGNVRIIGLNSIKPYKYKVEQIEWLDSVLTEACDSDSIDFVFAQFHLYHKSENSLTPDNGFPKIVVNKLEQFSTNCGKPSIHFFGHVHNYSRGHSRDHKHLWIDVASAGGNLHFPGDKYGIDYDEFSVTRVEHGFVLIEVTDDDDPKVVLKRISRGNQYESMDNEITDSITIRLLPSPVNTPVPISPMNKQIPPECVVLKAQTFSSSNISALHGQSHWQVSNSQSDFSTPVAESWKNFQNWFYDEDTQLNDDLSDEKFLGLSQNSNYWWRVRYRDRELNWSDWSVSVPFQTGESIALPNLLLNPGAEDSLMHWTVTQGIVETISSGECKSTLPYSGDFYFVVGGICEVSDSDGIFVQNIDVSAYADSVDTGNFPVNFGGYLTNHASADLPEMRLIFFDENNNVIDSSNTISTLENSWTMFSMVEKTPAQTRIIQVELKGTNDSGNPNHCYFDDLFLRLGTNKLGCDNSNSVVNHHIVPANLEVVPNPVESSGVIQLPFDNYEDVRLYMVDLSGSKVSCPVEYGKGKIYFQKGNLPKGIYLFGVKEKGYLIGVGKIVFH